MFDLVTMGEALIVGRASESLQHTDQLHLGVCGAESNVAIGLSRLGHSVAWIGRVGADGFGARIVSTLRGEGVDISHVVVDPTAPTAFMVKEQRASTTRVGYYRTGSAGSRLSPASLPPARLLHLTGITAAIAMDAALNAAQSCDRLSIDLNFRAALWPDRSSAKLALHELISRAELVFASEDELDLVSGSPRELVITRGARGASSIVDGVTYSQPALQVPVVDPVGAGDAFVAGYLSALLDGLGPQERLERGAILGAFAVTSHSDWQALPTRAELDLIRFSEGTTLR